MTEPPATESATAAQPAATPDVPLNATIEFEVPGTPEQVWEAIATGNGLSSWFVPTTLDEREGGTTQLDMGGGMTSAGTVTVFEPPHRLGFVEPNWAPVPTPVTPLAQEWLVEARSGGSCVLRIVSSAFGTGADWEREYFEGMDAGWRFWSEALRLHLSRYGGQRVSTFVAAADLAGTLAQTLGRVRDGLGVHTDGDRGEIHGLTVIAHQITGDGYLILRVTSPATGTLVAFGAPMGPDRVAVRVMGRLFGEGASEQAARQQPVWQSWLEGLGAPAAS